MKAIVLIVLKISFTTHVFKIGEYLTILPWARFGYEMIDNSKRGALRRVGYNHLVSKKAKKKTTHIRSPFF